LKNSGGTEDSRQQEWGGKNKEKIKIKNKIKDKNNGMDGVDQSN
jgi:hypothetical protein